MVPRLIYFFVLKYNINNLKVNSDLHHTCCHLFDLAGTKEWIRFRYFDSIVFFVVLPVFVYIFYPVASHHIFL